jgi:predicted O-linked N-acetylglucosamine transferase (SPINDLY family)
MLYRQILASRPADADALHLLGVAAHQTGKLDTAGELIRKALQVRPDWPEARYNLGLVLKDSGDVDGAIAAYRAALSLKPGFVPALNSLGNVLRVQHKLDEAIEAYQQGVASNPNYADAHNNLGICLKETGRSEEAIIAYHRALQLRPDFAEAANNLGVAYHSAGRLTAAVEAYRRAIAIKPVYAEAHSNLGVALREQGRYEEASAACRLAMELNPASAEAHQNLGLALQKLQKWTEAVAAHRRAVALNPGSAEAHDSLATALVGGGDLDGAIGQYKSAIAIAPENAVAHNNLGRTLLEAGDASAALAAFRGAVELAPRNALMHSAMVAALLYQPGTDPTLIAEEHFRWNSSHAEPLRQSIPPHRNDPNPGRRLRIGYISADFREHPVGRFLLPVLQQHDRGSFDVVCYSDVSRHDTLTAHLKAAADRWTETAGLTVNELAGRIRADAIDILVDLAGHTASNRLLVFAQKPAPVQVSYLGYPATTGLKAIDYRLTDAQADPPGATERWHSEQLWRLPRAIWCMDPDEKSPLVQPPPLLQNGLVTFGSFSNLAKVNQPLLRLWGRILRQVPDSRLLLKAGAFASTRARERVLAAFSELDVDADRLILLPPSPDHETHLAAHRQIDIALDTFPYHGTATTCDALWMGVPVISLAGDSHVSRVGVSLLRSIGLTELVAADMDEYVRIAIAWARDPLRLQTYGNSLRDRIKQSPLTDANGLAREIESAFRSMWRRWCGAP